MRRRVATVLILPKTLLREGLARLLSNTDYRPVRSVNCVDELVHDPELDADSALFIISWDACRKAAGRGAALPQVQMLKRQYPNARLLVLSDTFSVDDVVAALRAGANGYIMNTLTSGALIKSLDLVMFGETVLASEFSLAVREWSSKLLDSVPLLESQPPVSAFEDTDLRPRADEYSDMSRLSSRETAILSRLMLGDSNKIIARGIGVAEATVKTHIKAILRKIRVKNRTQAALWAFANLQRPLHPTPKMALQDGPMKGD